MNYDRIVLDNPPTDHGQDQDIAGATVGLPPSDPGTESRGKRPMRRPNFSLHYFPLYVSDWRDSTTRMRLNSAERGIFWELIIYSYKDGSLPNDTSILAKIADVPLREFLKCWPHVSRSFELREDGNWHNAKVDIILPDLERKNEQQRTAGQRSGESRRANAKRALNGRSTGAEPSEVEVLPEAEAQAEAGAKRAAPPPLAAAEFAEPDRQALAQEFVAWAIPRHWNARSNVATARDIAGRLLANSLQPEAVVESWRKHHDAWALAVKADPKANKQALEWWLKDENCRVMPPAIGEEVAW